MTINAHELSDQIIENRIKEENKAYKDFTKTCSDAISKMSQDSLESVVVEVGEGQINALEEVTESLREDGYKFAYIEVEDVSGDIVKRKLRISVIHLCRA